MHHKFEIKDLEGKRIEFTVHPDEGNMIKHVVDEIDLTLTTEKHMHDMVKIVQAFMGGNTITKLEVLEVEE